MSSFTCKKYSNTLFYISVLCCDETSGENMYKIMLLSFVVGCFVFWRVILPIKRWWKWIAAFPLGLAALKFPIIRLIGGPNLFAPAIPGWVILTGGWLYAAMIVFFFGLLLHELIRGPVLVKKSESFRKKWDSCAHCVLLVFTVIFVSIGVYNAIPVPRVINYKVKIKNLPKEASGLRIAVLADLHADWLTGKKRISGMVQRAMEQKADIIAIVGDFVDGKVERIAEEVSPLGELKAKYGVYGVPGNHEYYSKYLPWKKEFERRGITMLDNKNVVLPCNIAVAGVTDRAARKYELPLPDVKKAVAGIDESMPVILLAHRPELALEAAENRVALQVSGHTHGGMAPILKYFVARANYGFVSGRYKVKDTTLIVSNGSGIWNGFPVRIGVPAEIVVITLE